MERLLEFMGVPQWFGVKPTFVVFYPNTFIYELASNITIVIKSVV